MYWEISPDCHNEFVANVLCTNCFNYIFSNFYCCDNLNLDKSDKFAPLRASHNVDKAMLPYFGCHGCKLFGKEKPITNNYKVTNEKGAF